MIDMSPQAGTEMKGPHPAIILSERTFNVATGWIVVCPITSKIKQSPFEVLIPRGMKTHGCVVASEIRTMDYLARQTQFVEHGSLDLLQHVQAIACATIGCS